MRADTGLLASTIWCLRRDGLFLQPVLISRGRVDGAASLFLAWMKARACDASLPAPHGPYIPGEAGPGRPRRRQRQNSNLPKAMSELETSLADVLRKSVVPETSEIGWSARSAAEDRRRA